MTRGLPPWLVAYYAATVGAVGCNPYLSLLLSDTGLSDRQVALVLGLVPVGALVGGLVWASVADAMGSPVRVLRATTVLSVLTGLALLWVRNGWAMAGILLLWSLCRSPHVSLADAITVQVLGGDRRRYGQIRGVGSVAFLVIAWAGGALLPVWPRAPLGLSFALVAVGAALAARMPDEGALDRERPGRTDLWLLLRTFGPFLAVSVLHGVGLVCFDNFWSLHAEHLGLPSWMIGTGVAFAVVVEVAIMGFGRRLLDAFGPLWMMLFAVGMGVPQWALTATLTAPIALVPVQGLRGAAFGAFWIASVALLSERSPRRLANSAQALLPASSYGVGYLGCVGLAALLIERGTPVLFGAVAGVEAVAALVMLAVLATDRNRPV
jgi:PPP family 3-phenylpropionic acid transporter